MNQKNIVLNFFIKRYFNDDNSYNLVDELIAYTTRNQKHRFMYYTFDTKIFIQNRDIKTIEENFNHCIDYMKETFIPPHITCKIDNLDQTSVIFEW